MLLGCRVGAGEEEEEEEEEERPFLSINADSLDLKGVGAVGWDEDKTV